MSYPGRPGQRGKPRAKKAYDRESAEAIVPGAPNREGPNVKAMRIAVSKPETSRNRGHAQQAGTYARGGRRQAGRFLEALQAEGGAQVELIE